MANILSEGEVSERKKVFGRPKSFAQESTPRPLQTQKYPFRGSVPGQTNRRLLTPFYCLRIVVAGLVRIQLVYWGCISLVTFPTEIEANLKRIFRSNIAR
jgi:hypothetical protein